MQEERDTDRYERPNLQALDAELDRRIDAVLERKLHDPVFLERVLHLLSQHMYRDVKQRGGSG